MKQFQYISLFIFATSCSEFDDTFITTSENEILAENMDTPNMGAIRNYINTKHGELTRSYEYTLTPYLNGNDTVMFIANYENGDGWELFSNSTQTPMVLFKSPKGIFETSKVSDNNPINYLVRICSDNIKKIIRDKSDENNINQYTEWAYYSNSNIDNNNAHSISIAPSNESGSTFLVSSHPIEKRDTLEPLGGRLITRWHQDTCYNLFTPYYSDYQTLHTPVGCVAVAIGQFLYHSHFYTTHKPEGTVTEATYDNKKTSITSVGSAHRYGTNSIHILIIPLTKSI